jgi:hypothetical protein
MNITSILTAEDVLIQLKSADRRGKYVYNIEDGFYCCVESLDFMFEGNWRERIQKFDSKGRVFFSLTSLECDLIVLEDWEFVDANKKYNI